MSKVIGQKTVTEYTESGEIKRTIDVTVMGKPAKWEKDGQFLKVYPAFFESFLQDLQIEDSRLKLVVYLMSEAMKLQVNSDNAVYIDTAKASEAIGISQRSLYRCIKALGAVGFISQVSPRQTLYILNPEMVYKGNLVKYYAKSMTTTFTE